MDEGATAVGETAFVLSFDGAEWAAAYAAAGEILRELNQEAVLIEKALIPAEYYRG